MVQKKKKEKIKIVQINESTHTRLKIFVVKNKISILEFVDQAVNEKLKAKK